MQIRLYKLISFVILIFICCRAIYAADSEKLNISPLLEYYEDINGDLEFNEIKSLNSKAWDKNSTESLNFFFSKSVFWLKINSNSFKDFLEQNSYLVFEWKALDSVQLFYINKNGMVEKQIAGDSFSKSQWTLPDAHFPAFLIRSDSKPIGFIYARLQSTSIKNFPVIIKSEKKYQQELQWESILIFVYSTIIFILIIFAIFLYVISKDKTYLYYTGYIFAIGLAFDITYGNAFDLFWPEATWWQSRAGFTFIGAQILFSFLFASRLLDLPRYTPRIYFFSKITMFLCAISIPLTLFEISVAIFSRFYSLIYLLSIPAFFTLGIYLLPRSGLHVRFFIIGWGVFFFFGIFHILYASNVLPFSNFYVYSVIFALPIDIFFFFISIWEKQKNMEKQLAEKLSRMSNEVDDSAVSKYQKSSLSDLDIDKIQERLKILMQQEKIFLLENIRLPDVAKSLQINRSQLSELLNSKYKTTFPAFINGYRIEEAKKLLRENKEMNILEIAYATGFGSKAAFTTEFKRIAGLTASEFREKNKS